MRCQRNLAFWSVVRSDRSFFVRWGYVSGKKKNTSTVPKPPSAVWSQNISRQERNVTITPYVQGYYFIQLGRGEGMDVCIHQ